MEISSILASPRGHLITLSARYSTIGGANMLGSGFGFVHGDTLRKIACCI
jgi:hypothetical protein